MIQCSKTFVKTFNFSIVDKWLSTGADHDYVDSSLWSSVMNLSYATTFWTFQNFYSYEHELSVVIIHVYNDHRT